MRIRKYLATVLSIISIVPICLIMIFSVMYFEQNSAQSLKTSIESTSRLTAANINQFFSQRKMALEVVSDLSNVRQLLLNSNLREHGTEYEQERSNVVETFKTMTTKQTIEGQGNTKGNYVRCSSLVNLTGSVIASDDSRLIGQPAFLNIDMRTVPAYDFYISPIMQSAGFINGQKYLSLRYLSIMTGFIRDISNHR